MIDDNSRYRKHYKKRKKQSLYIIYAIFVFFGLTIGTIDPITPILAEELNASYARIGLVIFYSIVCLILSNLSAGYLSDRYSMKRIILAGTALSASGLFFFGIYLDFATLIVYLVLIRLGFGMLDPTTYNYFSGLFNSDERTSVFIKINLSWFAGLVLGPLIISLALYMEINPRTVFSIISVIFAALIITFYIVSGEVKKDSGPKKAIGLSVFKEVFRDPFILIMGLIYLFYSGSVFGLATWLTTYFLDFGVLVSISSVFLSIYWLASIAGLFVTLKISIRSREKNIFLVSVLSGTVCSMVIALTNEIILKVVFIFLQGMTLAAVMPLIKTISIRKKPGIAGTVVGLILMFQGIGILVFQPVLGFIASRFGKGYIIYAVMAGLIVASILSIINHFVYPEK